MITMLQWFIAPLLTALLTLWAAWLALAAESDDLPRSLSGQLGAESGAGTLSRDLHVAHLALLMLAGAAAGGAVAWWAWAPALGLVRLFLAVLLIWVLGDLVPRLLAAVAPELTLPLRRAAIPTLVPFRPLLRLATWADECVKTRQDLSPRRAGRSVRCRSPGRSCADRRAPVPYVNPGSGWPHGRMTGPEPELRPTRAAGNPARPSETCCSEYSRWRTPPSLR